MVHITKHDVLNPSIFPRGMSSSKIDWVRVECTDTEASTTITWEFKPTATSFTCVDGTAYDIGGKYARSSKNESPSIKVSGVLILAMTFISYIMG